MGTYTKTLSNKTVYANSTEFLLFGSLNVPSSEYFVRFKIEKSNALGTLVILSDDGTNRTLTSGTWYTDLSYINNSLVDPRAKAKNNGSSVATSNFTLTVETQSRYTAVVAGNKIVKEDINQTGTAINAGNKIEASIKSGLTAGNKITAADFNSIVLGL